MLDVLGIYSNRNTPQPYYWDVVYEWEDELAKALGIPVIPIGEQYDRIYKPGAFKKVLNRLNCYQLKDKFFFRPRGYHLAFHIGPPGVYSFHSRRDVIPIIIDFWKHEDLARFESIFSLSRIVFVTSKEAHSYLIDQHVGLNVRHLPLSLPDRYLGRSNSEKRRFDLLQLGRQNATLTNYTHRLLNEHPEIDYVYAEASGGSLKMISTHRGLLGEFSTRESFLNLLAQAKVSLLSAPGIDSDSVRTGGFSPVTPRFFESAACGCHLVGVYPDNEDFKYMKIHEICPRISDYDHFKATILDFLNRGSIPNYQRYLSKNVTSIRAKEMMDEIRSMRNG